MAAAESGRKGAPPQPAAERTPKKLTRKEKSAANKARYTDVRTAVQNDVRAMRASAIAEWPRKNPDHRGPILRYTKKPIETKYTDELDANLFKLVCTGASLDTISNLEGMPELYELLAWLADETSRFALTYTRARKLVVPLYENRAMDVALNPTAGLVKIKKQVVTKGGGIVTVREEQSRDAVERAKLAMSAYQWALGWMVPKKHGKLPDLGDQKKNEQLEALFQSLKSGPVETP
jgi:hypothetical protein